jgi:peptidoglycan/LPS O-acetylase OafA/YrhL
MAFDEHLTGRQGFRETNTAITPISNSPVLELEHNETLGLPVAHQQFTTARKRLAFIDGLRGLAAVAVVLFHLFGIVHSHPIYAIQPTVFYLIATYGRLGVQVFFVLSAFVIAYSLQDAVIDCKFLLRFIVRRSIRLDPPYWLTILLASIVALAATHLFHARHYPIPTLNGLFAHLFYLQGIMGCRQIVAVFWTLCIEVQFYLAFIILLWILSRRREAAPPIPGVAFAVILMSTGLVSLLASQSSDQPINYLYEYWYAFCLGALVCRGMVARDYCLPAIAIMIAGTASVLKADLNAAASTVAACVILVSARANRLDNWLADPVSQFFGRISYSLYLLHLVVIPPIINLFYRLYPDSVTMSVAANALALASTVLVSAIFYRFVERPSAQLASKLKLVPAR